jgi:dihydropteroate synthase
MTTLGGAAIAPLAAPSVPGGDGCRVMGILNVTPDSFSDGGRFVDVGSAVAHGLALAAAGADLVDVGGESTRPGAVRVSVDEELRRVVPVVGELAAAGVAVSVDTMWAPVAEAAVAAGACLVNDVSGGLADPAMIPFLAEAEVHCVLMHWRAHAAVMQQHAVYDDVVEDVRDELARRCDAAVGAGVVPGRIVLDPGLGFAKSAAHSWTLLGALPRLASLGFPVLVGASRKGFLRECVDVRRHDPDRPTDRDEVSAAVVAVAAAAGAWGVRVHDVSGALAGTGVAARLRSGAGS